MRALLFDLDGTLIDSVYAHVYGWQQALAEVGVSVDAYLVHRRIGMSGALLGKTLSAAAGHPLDEATVKQADERHSEIFKRILPEPRALSGAVELLALLRERRIRHGIATAGKRAEIAPALALLGVGNDTVVIDADDVTKEKPEPDAFVACAKKLRVAPEACYVVGDSVWDLLAAQRGRMLSIGVLTGGSGEDELTGAGASRVFRDPAALARALDELSLEV